MNADRTRPFWRAMLSGVMLAVVSAGSVLFLMYSAWQSQRQVVETRRQVIAEVRSNRNLVQRLHRDVRKMMALNQSDLRGMDERAVRHRLRMLAELDRIRSVVEVRPAEAAPVGPDVPDVP